MIMARLTQAALDAALEACGGFGYSTARNLLSDEDGIESETGVALVSALDAEIVRRFNELDLSRSDLFAWVDSKLGRWLVDEASEFVDVADAKARRDAALALVSKYVTIERVRTLVDLGVSM